MLTCISVNFILELIVIKMIQIAHTCVFNFELEGILII